MNINLLQEWKERIIFESHSLNPNSTLIVNRALIEKAFSTLKIFFGLDFFSIETFEKYLLLDNPIESNWLHHMLTTTNAKSINRIIEITDIIDHFTITDKNLLDNLRKFSRLDKFRHFRDYLFELYCFFIFDKNGIECNKKIYEGDLELEGEIIINGEKCLFECRKLYHKKDKEQAFNMQLVSNISRRMSKYTDPVMIGIKYKKAIPKFKNMIVKEVDAILKKWISSRIIYPTQKHYFDGDLILNIEHFFPGRFEEESKKNYEGKNCVLMEFGPVDKSLTSTSNIFRCSTYFGFTILNMEIEDYIINQIDAKRRKRSNSKYEHRIYLFESEISSGFDYGILSPSGISEEVSNSIQKYLDTKKTKDIVIIVDRNSVRTNNPKIRHTIFSNNVDESIIEELSKVKFDLYQ